VRAALGAIALVVELAACGPAASIAPGPAQPLPPHREVMIDTTPKARRRMLPPEIYLRAYMTWFGGLAPLDVQAKAKPRGMFDAWDDYLSALGLPDYRLDLPRAQQSNTLMLATLGRLGEVLCDRAVEHDLHGKPPAVDQRVVFAFEVTKKPPTVEEFAQRFDVLHRTFLGYPVALAPPARVGRFYALYNGVVARHAPNKKPVLTADETGWAAVCTALVQHPEVELY
jgi:hypothetical protein